MTSIPKYWRSTELLRPFEITPTDGFVYDLRQTPIFQKAFTY
ncbi:hypothetical protein [Lactobacillus delbrueckii]|nr:hypothetical protein [Lactobacillus delbrueckii]